VNPAEPAFAAAPSLVVYTVYQFPLDYPDKWIVRPFVIKQYIPDPIPQRIVCICNSLRDARAGLQGLGLYRVERQPGDDPPILETWL
jgi:hypothetical protein